MSSWRVLILIISAVVLQLSGLIWRYIDEEGLSFFHRPRNVYVKTEYATYRGLTTKSGTTTIFYGIPYALPPVGERRFRAPVPLTTEHTEQNMENGGDGQGETGQRRVIDARKPRQFCIQGSTRPDTFESGGAGSEDCLILNIYTPWPTLSSSRNHTNDDINSSEGSRERVGGVKEGGVEEGAKERQETKEEKRTDKLPVLVYIHGGGFIFGNPLSWPFEHWIEQFPEIVIVSIYYRLSIFGFLASPPNSNGDVDGLDYNAGFLDQIEALKWVKNNIGAFGGDPDKITIDGQSAGGESVLLHLVTDGGKQQLFQQAIGQSVYRLGLTHKKDTGDHFSFVATEAGCSEESWTNKQKTDCLREKDSGTLIRAAEAAQRHNPIWRYVPVIDGNLIREAPTVSINQGKFSHVPMIVGATTDESPIGSTEATMEDILKLVYPALNKADIRVIDNMYTAKDYENESKRISTAIGEALFRCGRELLGEALTRVGRPAFAYRWNEMNPTQQGPGVQHSAENWWMFQGSNTGTNGTYKLTPFIHESWHKFAKESIAYWVSFVRSGDPNTYATSGAPHWPVWQKDQKGSRRRMVMHLGSDKAEDFILAGAHDQILLGDNNQPNVIGVEEEEESYLARSYAEYVAPEEFRRCKTINDMAGRLHF